MKRRRIRGFIRRPTVNEVKELAKMEYINLSDEEAQSFTEIIAKALSAVDAIDEMPQPKITIKWTDRDPGYRPDPEEDPHNLFIRKCLVKGSPVGKLAGKKVAIKDNIAVAGVPMTNGSRSFSSLMPEYDAVVVERILDAGGTIIGKLNQDDMSFCGTSETSSFGQVRNPVNVDFSPGGSSSASGAVLVAGEADLALAVDQAGSARMPAAWTGVYSIKATHGLIPSFGSFHFDHTLDFICPVAKNVSDLAAFLEVLAGEDARDPQWVRGPIKVEEYTKSLTKDISGMKIGVIKESFEWDFASPDVCDGVRAAAENFKKLGASVEEISVPMWQDALFIWLTLTTHSVSAMIESEAQGFWHKGMAIPSFADYFGKSRRLGSDHFPPSIKLTMIMGKYLRRNYYNTYYAKAQNLRNYFKGQIDQMLEKYDILVTPTICVNAYELLTENITDSEWTERAISNVHNTCPLNITGHPAIAVPCGVDKNKLPISMQLIGADWSESRLIRAAYAYEQGQGMLRAADVCGLDTCE